MKINKIGRNTVSYLEVCYNNIEIKIPWWNNIPTEKKIPELSIIGTVLKVPKINSSEVNNF